METTQSQLPDAHGHFGTYGGMFVPETLMSALTELTDEYARAKEDAAFQNELDHIFELAKRNGKASDPLIVAKSL